jgi:hypothetical protein
MLPLELFQQSGKPVSVMDLADSSLVYPLLLRDLSQLQLRMHGLSSCQNDWSFTSSWPVYLALMTFFLGKSHSTF